ncbi:MAG: Na+/H+ antiporter [Steroidobacteraceae bacterium]|jgi:CPA1 family monovalent cation:H+ antiporter
MIPTIQILIILLGVIAAVALIAARLEIPPAILLVLAGVVLALVPGLPTVRLEPEFVLLFVLPPIIYASAVAMSWREFRFNLRPISLLAVGCVLFTTIAAAAVTHWLLGFSWPVGFLLGAIVSPPDAVAPLAIARRMQLPRRLIVILEGEGLANDASALILYRFAIAAVSLSVFSLGHATGMFVAIIGGEILWGIGVGWLMLRLRHWVHDTRIEIMLSLLTPFVAYWPPQHLGGSGVLATVTTGLYISWNGLRLISAETRLQGIFFWDFLMYLTEGFVFLITGLQARTLLAGIHGDSLSDLARSAAVVCAVIILARFIWLFPATYLPRWLIPSIRRDDPSPPWQWPFALAFTGIRGTVSLAAALAIPLTTESGALFPDRDRILFLTFAVILVTLVGQGLLLPTVIRVLGLANAGRREHHNDRVEEFAARKLAIEAASKRLDELVAERELAEDLVRPLRARHHERLRHVEHRGNGDEGHKRTIELHDEIEYQLIGAERDQINDLYRRGKLKDEARRRIERELDLRDAQLTNLRSSD